MKSLTGTLLAILLTLAPAAGAADVKLEDDTQKAVYALGLSIARSLSVFNLSENELKLLEEGLADGVLGRTPKVELEVAGPKIQELAKARTAATAEQEKKAADEFLKKAAAEKGAVKSDSGVIFTEVTKGSGPSPTADNTVKVNYKGTLRDGTVFDSSYDRKTPVTFALKQVIPCWTEGLQKMHVGGKGKLVCPSSVAYGDRGAPPHIKPGAALVFDVELLEIVQAPAASAKPDAKSGAKPDAKSEAKSEAKPDAKSEAKPDAKK
ncbi:MAG: FKBP-type peptidyl-prolyl cis-trans isomerase [Candidatus Binatia bacterium]